MYPHGQDVYEECSTHVFFNPTVVAMDGGVLSLALKPVESGLLRFLRTILGTDAKQLDVTPPTRTFCAQFTFRDPTIVPGLVLEAATRGADAIEVRIDMLFSTTGDARWESPSDATFTPPRREFLANAIGHIRRHSPLPIIYTVRSTAHGGNFPRNPDKYQNYLDLVHFGAKLGCEYVDIELSLPDAAIVDLLSRCQPSKSILSFHELVDHVSWIDDRTRRIYTRAAHLGADIVRICRVAFRPRDNWELLLFQEEIHSLNGPPLAALNMGEPGQLARVLNPVLTPISSNLLPGAQFPGTLSFRETHQALALAGVLGKKYFNFARSSGFGSRGDRFRRGVRLLGLPYVLAHVPNKPCDLVQNSGSFGGALVLHGEAGDSPLDPGIPWSARVSATGRADIIVPSPLSARGEQIAKVPMDSSRHPSPSYDNLRPLAIEEAVSGHLAPINVVTANSVALLLGLQGSSLHESLLALQMLGIHKVLLHSCQPRPEGLGSVGSSITTTVLSDLQHFLTCKTRPKIIMCSGHATPSCLPDQLFESATGGVLLVLDSLAHENDTARVFLARPSRFGWNVVGEREVDQARIRLEFRALTGKRLPLYDIDDREVEAVEV
jgi:3-dehydroquinate dehydratase type I